MYYLNRPKIPKYLLLIILWVFFSCVHNDNEHSTYFDFSQFEKERKLWETQSIDSYKLVLETLLNIPTVPVQITITPFNEPLIECLPDFCDDYNEDYLTLYTMFGKTVQEMFFEVKKQILKTIDENKNEKDKNRWTNIICNYNNNFHYIEYFFISSMYGDLPEPGGGFGFQITNFEKLGE
jgi:hypothetical protein